MIISASRRTDIPAFYSDWLINRIREGFVLVRNPMNAHSISKVSLAPDVVDAIVLWTKNPVNILPHLHHFESYLYYFQFTITPYDHVFEAGTANKKRLIDVFRRLSEIIGPRRTIWRYDPIILTDDFDIEFHRKEFNWMAEALEGYTSRCVISFLDLYKKTERNLSGIPIRAPNSLETYEIAQTIVEIANKYSINVVTCAEDLDLLEYGIERGKCIDDKLISELAGRQLIMGKDKNQREECGCVMSIDIGAYNTCPHGCLYCYANFNSEMVKKNVLAHSSESALLFGEVNSGDKVTDRVMKSCFAVQQNLF